MNGYALAVIFLIAWFFAWYVPPAQDAVPMPVASIVRFWVGLSLLILCLLCAGYQLWVA